MTGGTQSNESLVIEALEAMGAVVGKSKRGYVEASCPLAAQRHEGGVDRNPSFGVVYNSGEAHLPEGVAHCFSCGYSGDLREIASLLFSYNELDREALSHVMTVIGQIQTGALPLSLSTTKADDPFPSEDWLSNFPPVSTQYPKALHYLLNRGIERKAIQHFGLRVDPLRHRIVFALRDRAQRFRGVMGRTLLPHPTGPRYFSYPYHKVAPRGFTWWNENALDLSKPVLVVEGVFDVLKCWPVYPNTVAALSIAFREPGLAWHKGVPRWITMFDRGKGGQSGRERLSAMAAKTGARVWHLMPPPERDDPGESEPAEILEQLNTLKR